MANERRVRANFVGGLIDDAPLTSGATTLTSNALQALQVIDATQHMVIVLDPDGCGGVPEIAYLTGHTSASATATLLRAQEGSTARAHVQDTPWVHSATAKDFDAAGGGVGLIGISQYNPATQSTIAATTTMADVDATNLLVSFTAPPSGKVLVRMTARAEVANNVIDWGLREASSDVAGSAQLISYDNANHGSRFSYTALFTGLAPGVVKTWKWAHRCTSGSPTTVFGSNGTAGQAGPAVMEVWAVNI